MIKKLLIQQSQLSFRNTQHFSVAKFIKQLRDETGSPMLQCKKALAENDNDVEKAKEYLKQKGLAQAGKYSQKETREGIVGIRISQDSQRASLMELNCQTDFVARTESFLAFSDVFLRTLITSPQLENQNLEVESPEEIQQFQQENALIEQVLPQATKEAKISEVQQYLISHLQENINLRRFAHYQTNKGLFGCYVHNTLSSGLGLKSCLVELELQENKQIEENQTKIRELANNIALQILGNKPLYLTKNDIPSEVLAEEKQKIIEDFGDKLKGKPEQVQNKMVEGKLNKFYEDKVLYNQQYIFCEEDESLTIEKYIKQVEKEVGDSISIKKHYQWACNE